METSHSQRDVMPGTNIKITSKTERQKKWLHTEEAHDSTNIWGKVNNVCSIKKRRTFCPVIAILVCNTSSEYIVRKGKGSRKKEKAQHPQVISYKAEETKKHFCGIV
jgi:hypothetical protein